MYEENEVQGIIQVLKQAVVLNVLVEVFEIQINELHDQYVLRELVHLLIPQLVLSDLQALILQAVDRHLAQTVLPIITLIQMRLAENHEALDSTAHRVIQLDIQFEETEFELDLKSEMIEIQLLMMAAAICELSKLDMHALAELLSIEMCVILSEEMGL